MAASGRGVWWRRVVAVPLVFVSLSVSSVAVAPSAGAVAGFGDVEPSAFSTRAVQWMVDNAITLGVTDECFEPHSPIDRGQAAVFMWRMEGAPAPAAPHGFADVSNWMSDAVAWMVEQAVTLGTSANTYSPGQILTRAELVTFLWRLAGSPAPSSTMHPFTDIVPGAFYYTAVLWAVGQEITLGTTATTFSPGDTVTRGQVATFFYRYKDEPPVTVDPASPLCRGRDDFNATLQAGWTSVSDGGTQSLDVAPGFLAMQGAVGGGYEDLLRDPVGDNYVVEARLRFWPDASNPGSAGLAVADDAAEIITGDAFDGLSFYRAVGGVSFDSYVNGALDEEYFLAVPDNALFSTLTLRIRHDNATYTASVRLDRLASWSEVGSINRAFSDPVVDVFAGSLGPLQPDAAFFDWFSERAL